MDTISSADVGEVVTQFFVIRSLEYRTGKSRERGYISIEFGYRNGRIFGNIWKDAENIIKEYSVGDIVKVRGTLEIFKERKRLSVDRIRKCTGDDTVDKTDFIPQFEGDREKLKKEFMKEAGSVKNPHLKKLLDSFFKDKKFFKEFCNAAGGKLWHHAYIGGLMEHSLSVVKLCKKAAEIYETVDGDLLITGAILHDIGKVTEYTITPFIDFSDEGRLIGHIVIGANMVEEKIKSIHDFPEELKRKLIHMILSHQGALENASPVVPMTLEAVILHYAENLDSKANAFTRIIKQEKEPGIKWSKYVNLIDRFIYFGEDESK